MVCWLIACVDTKSNGLFFQQRVGRYGKLFTIFKLRTMAAKSGHISVYGAFMRKYKIDELPQLLNVFLGKMSMVGPRPDIVGYYDTLIGENRKILELKPGLTSEAALKYRNEEQLLKLQTQPQKYNDEVILPDKVALNLNYYYQRTFFGDLRILLNTLKVILT
jgi:lipopolysaccharide/colanic/teichoic acid biosynthesis glycosyltransferase